MDGGSDKTEQATPKKLRDAQAKGMALRSADLSTLAGFVVAAVALMLVPATAAQIGALVQRSIENAAADPEIHGFAALNAFLAPGINLLVVLSITGISLALLAATAFGGIHFSMQPLTPDFSRLHPGNGLKKILSAHTLAETGKTLLKCIALMIVALMLAKSTITTLASAHFTNTVVAPRVLLHMAWQALGWTLAIQFAFTAFDLWYANRKYRGQLRMTRSEVKDEHRHQEGDPETRRRRKRLYSTLQTQVRALGDVKDADVIITNPTHVAVALRYDATTMDAPVMSCAGRGTFAAAMRMLARRHGVPMLRNPALARALIADHRIGDGLRREHQQQVVFIYRWLLARPGHRIRMAR